MATIRNLINTDGSPFSNEELAAVERKLDELSDREKEVYRNRNACSISEFKAKRLLIVSGPGTGKSYFFLGKIKQWFQSNPNSRILVTSFVKKLVTDLTQDIVRDVLISRNGDTVDVTTLHGLARSIVEKNKGTKKWPFNSHIRIIAEDWKEIIWKDVLVFNPELNAKKYPWAKFEEQLHNHSFEDTPEWRDIGNTYLGLCRFYNAAGFADLIIRAKIALTENPSINSYNYFIVDEFQDFNIAESEFIMTLTAPAIETIIVGDDDQVLYERLKSSKPSLIRNLYQDRSYVKAMLPFCSRCNYHISKAASSFIKHCHADDANCIEKVFLPLVTSEDCPRIKVIACATPGTAVDYLRSYVTNNRDEIEARRARLSSNEENDAYILILSPSKGPNFFSDKAKDELVGIVSEYKSDKPLFTEDYYKLMNYYFLAGNPSDNFIFRKVLHYENLDSKLYDYLSEAVRNNTELRYLDSTDIRRVLTKSNEVRTILNEDIPLEDKIDRLKKLIIFESIDRLTANLLVRPINETGIEKTQLSEEEADIDEKEVKRMSAIELMTIVSSKGLTADHVFVLGFDDVNMKHISTNAFYVAITRARKSLHIITALKSGGARRAHEYLSRLSEDHVEFLKYTKQRKEEPIRNRAEFERYLANCQRRAHR